MLVDYTKTGSGMASFTRVLTELFPEEMAEDRPVLFAYVSKPEEVSRVKNNLELESQKFQFPCTYLPYELPSEGKDIPKKCGEWEYSFIGIRQYHRGSWITEDPLQAPRTGEIEHVLENAERAVWDFEYTE